MFPMQPRVDGRGLHLPIIGLRGFGVPLPCGVPSSCEGAEGVTDDGKISFDVHAKVRGLGLIIRHRGTLAPVP